jgi:hypothetical protein
MMGIVWFAGLMLFASDLPMNHKFISHREKEYIIKEINNYGQTNSDEKVKMRVFYFILFYFILFY